ncbi:MAG: hypothetical protein AUH43_13940 [Acidobacteria bacterium 13_1_40CM_65_14]|nr:MAG: hypothetical protein AUH43_13940 [Acidobacteria bacterium 13_1_40CM_65_14]OLC83918.1 MAG: hypothetical protein AUH72_03180 [Acidobacteria bacterium 13_1_40CM_4_65_8]
MSYPVSVDVTPALTNRNRLTTAFRLILAIPHLILVGGVGLGFAWIHDDSRTRLGSESGLLGAVAFFLAIVSWFTIVFTGRHVTGIRQFTAFYMRWRVRALAYLMLLEDPYPPFGDAPYPASLTIVDPIGPRDRVTVGFRIFLGIPHVIVLVCLVFAWWITSFVAWLAILLTGAYPQGLYDFGVGVLRWLLRVEAYMLLLVDDYPPFSFS